MDIVSKIVAITFVMSADFQFELYIPYVMSSIDCTTAFLSLTLPYKKGEYIISSAFATLHFNVEHLTLCISSLTLEQIILLNSLI